jgi:hypothetical protein
MTATRGFSNPAKSQGRHALHLSVILTTCTRRFSAALERAGSLQPSLTVPDRHQICRVDLVFLREVPLHGVCPPFRQGLIESLAPLGIRVAGDDKRAALQIGGRRQAPLDAPRPVGPKRWNRRLATGRDMLWSPTIRAALFAGTPWMLLLLLRGRAGRAGRSTYARSTVTR